MHISMFTGHNEDTQGICGTCNGKEDDLKTSNGLDVSMLRNDIASIAIIDSYQVGDWKTYVLFIA